MNKTRARPAEGEAIHSAPAAGTPLTSKAKPRQARRATTAVAGVLALGAALAGVAAYAATQQIIAVGTMAYSDLIGGPATVTMRLFTVNPGEVLGWHYHPGAGAFTVVQSGTINIEDGCGGEKVYTEGQAFLEPPNRVHRGKNLTGQPVVTAQTFIVPQGLDASIPTGVQLCGPPAAVAECKGDGWTTFNHPRSFVSAGDCLQYVLTGK